MSARTLRIGDVDVDDPFRLPPELITQTMAVCGIRGSGKTVTVAVIVEELLKLGHQVVVIDPTDVWWGLKSSADGQAAGFPVVVLGGEHGDLPLAADSGRAIADFVVNSGTSVVLSLRHLRKGPQRTFVTDFAEQLYHRKGEAAHRVPIFVVIDEASTYVPQKVMGTDARMVGAIEDLVRKGRASGIGVALIDQRPASVNKDVLTQLEVLVCHRITSPQDRKALDEWIRQHDTQGGRDTFLSDLPALPQGAAWFWSPSLDVFSRVQVRMRETFDSSKTPKLGEAPPVPDRLAEVDLEALREQLEAAVAEAAANDPKTLNKRIAELEAQVAAGGSAPIDNGALDRARADGFAKGEAHAAGMYAELARQVREREAHVAASVQTINAAVASITTAANSLGAAATVPATFAETMAPLGSRPPVTPAATSPDSTTARPQSRRRSSPGQSPGGQPRIDSHQRILNAIAELNALGIAEPSRKQVGMLAGYNLSSGSGAAHVAALREAGRVEIPSPGVLVLTDAGREIASSEGAPRRRKDLHDRVFAKLTDGERRILEHLITLYPESAARSDVGSAVFYNLSSGTGAAHVARLIALDFAEIPKPGLLRVSDLLFPKGLKP